MQIDDPILIWGQLLHRIRPLSIDDHGHPTSAELSALLKDAMKEAGAPSEVVSYVGARLRNEIHLGDGGRPADPLERWASALDLKMQVGMCAAALRRQGVRGPKERALEFVSKDGSALNTLRKRISRRNLRDLPRGLEHLDVDDERCEKAIEELLEEEAIKLDPVAGFIWLDTDQDGTAG